MQLSNMSQDGHKRFANKDCPFYPCHDVPQVNCIFCFCPLYHLTDCGGQWTKTAKGIKDCSKCKLPHGDDGWDIIVARLIAENKAVDNPAS